MRWQQSQSLVSVSTASPGTQLLPAVSWDAQSDFSPFLFRAVGRTIKMEGSVDDEELLKLHLYPLSFRGSSFPCAHLGNAVRWLQPSSLLLGRILSAETPGETDEKPQGSWKLTQEEICPCCFPGSDEGEDWGYSTSFDLLFWANLLNHRATF